MKKFLLMLVMGFGVLLCSCSSGGGSNYVTVTVTASSSSEGDLLSAFEDVVSQNEANSSINYFVISIPASAADVSIDLSGIDLSSLDSGDTIELKFESGDSDDIASNIILPDDWSFVLSESKVLLTKGLAIGSISRKVKSIRYDFRDGECDDFYTETYTYDKYDRLQYVKFNWNDINATTDYYGYITITYGEDQISINSLYDVTEAFDYSIAYDYEIYLDPNSNFAKTSTLKTTEYDGEFWGTTPFIKYEATAYSYSNDRLCRCDYSLNYDNFNYDYTSSFEWEWDENGNKSDVNLTYYSTYLNGANLDLNYNPFSPCHYFYDLIGGTKSTNLVKSNGNGRYVYLFNSYGLPSNVKEYRNMSSSSAEETLFNSYTITYY